jgi:hypothetical protein
MRVELFYCAVFLFMTGLLSLLFLNSRSPNWMVLLALFCMVSGGIVAAVSSCVFPQSHREEAKPLKTRETDQDVSES